MNIEHLLTPYKYGKPILSGTGTEGRFDRNAVLKFIISDTGIGMSEEFLPHIFDPFSQEDASSTSKYGSTGLGMPITKSIVELMNGHIDVVSKKGEGTTFTVTVTLGESDRKQQIDESGLVPHDISVLVIDDDPIALEHAEIVLNQVGISCETAESGFEGLDKVRIRHGRREDYNLIIIDWKMPEIDGIETTRQIRKIVGTQTPVIILTSFNWDDVADEAREAGADTFVAKPLFASTVMDEFAEAFRSKNEVLVEKTADLKGRRVLLAEDVAVNAEIMMMVLSMREMEVDLAENGLVAVNLFESHEPGYYDAILMDMRMPEMDGLQATQAIRAMDELGAAGQIISKTDLGLAHGCRTIRNRHRTFYGSHFDGHVLPDPIQIGLHGVEFTLDICRAGRLVGTVRLLIFDSEHRQDRIRQVVPMTDAVAHLSLNLSGSDPSGREFKANLALSEDRIGRRPLGRGPRAWSDLIKRHC